MGTAAWLALSVLLGLLVAPWLLPTPALLLMLASVGCALVALAAARTPGCVAPAAVLCGLTLGLSVWCLRPPGPVARGLVSVSGRVTGAPVGPMADVLAHRMHQVATGDVQRGRVRVRFEGRAPPPGTEVVLQGRAHAPRSAALPGGPDLASGVGLVRIRTEVVAQRWHRVGAPARRRLPPGSHGGVLHALAWGDRTYLDVRLVERMRRTGTAHLLAISGFHVGLVAGAVGGLLRALLRAISVMHPPGIPVRWVWFVGAVAAWSYAYAAGAPIGAQRAALVLTGIGALTALGLQVRGLDLLCVAAAAVAVADPASLASPGLQLSFGAVLGLLRLTPLFEAWRPRRWPRLLRPVWTSMSASIAATLGTLPAVGWWFQAVSCTAPAANLIAGPTVSLVLVPLAAIHALGPAWLDPVVGSLTDGAVGALLLALAPLDQEPLPIGLGPVGAGAVALALLVHTRKAWLLAFLVAIAPGVPAPRQGIRVTLPHLGRGAGALVEWPDGQRWLVDGGPSRDAMLRWLRRRGVTRLDVVIASSGRAPHAGGLGAVVAALPVGQVWIPPNSRSDPDLRDLVSTAVALDVPVIPGPALDLEADARAWLRDEGDRSVVLGVGGPSEAPRLLLTGDLGPRGAAEVARRAQAVEVLLAPRHAGRVSGGAAPWRGVLPGVVIVQGEGADEGGLQDWRRRGARVFRTDVDGTIEVVLEPDGARIRTWRAGRGWLSSGRVTTRVDPWLAAGADIW